MGAETMAPPGMGNNPMIAGAALATHRGGRKDSSDETIDLTNPIDSKRWAKVRIKTTVATSFQLRTFISELYRSFQKSPVKPKLQIPRNMAPDRSVRPMGTLTLIKIRTRTKSKSNASINFLGD